MFNRHSKYVIFSIFMLCTPVSAVMLDWYGGSAPPAGITCDTVVDTDGTSGDYSSLSGAITGIGALSANHTICLRATTGVDDTTAVTISGVASSTYSLTITSDGSNRHSGKFDGSLYVLHPTHNYGMQVIDTNVTIDGIQVQVDLNYASSAGKAIRITPATTVNTTATIINNILFETAGEGLVSYGLMQLDGVAGPGTNVAYIVNNIIYGATSGSGIRSDSAAWTAYAYNNTLVDLSVGITAGSGDTINAKNIGMASVTTATGGIGTINQTTNSTTTPTFVDATNKDYHITAGDTTWKSNGTDLSADGNYSFSDDIDGDTRSNWSIGADD